MEHISIATFGSQLFDSAEHVFEQALPPPSTVARKPKKGKQSVTAKEDDVISW